MATLKLNKKKVPMGSCSLHTKFSSLGITTQTQSFISPFPGFSSYLPGTKKKKLAVSHLLKSNGRLFRLPLVYE